MELKRTRLHDVFGGIVAFNRTSMELKRGSRVVAPVPVSLLIEPVWN